MGGSIVVVLVVLVAGTAVVAGYAVVRCAELLRDARARLIADAAEFNARMTARNRPHTWVVPSPSRTERVIYAVADRLSPTRARRNRHAAAVHAAIGGGH